MGCGGSLPIGAVAATPKRSLARPRTRATDQVSEGHKRLVRKSWKILCDDLTGRGSRIFLRIFARNPHVKELFPCRYEEGEALLKNANFKGHASRFMQAVGAAVDNIDNLETTLSPVLVNLGRQHIHFKGFKAEYFEVFKESMLHTFGEDLGRKWTDDMISAWSTVLDFIMCRLQEGYFLATEEAAAAQTYAERPTP